MDESPKDPVPLEYQANERLPMAARAIPLIERAARVHLLVAVVTIVVSSTVLDGGDLLRASFLLFGITSLMFSAAVVGRAVQPVRHIGRIALWSALFGSVCILIYVAGAHPERRMEKANQIKCASNLRAVGQAMLAYAGANGGQFPSSLDQLCDGSLAMSTFVCPSTTDTPAPSIAAAQQAGELTLGGHLSYIYCGRGLQVPANNMVLLWEWPTNHFGSGSNALFGDGHVEWLAPWEVADLEAGVNPPRRVSPQSKAVLHNP